MNIPFWPILWLTGKFNRKMHVSAQQTIHLERLDHYLRQDGNDLTHHGIIDLGGGGEGIIGQLMGSHVTAVDIRQDELNDAPNGPKKVVADARDLPFDAETFDCATAFYFYMYLKSEDYLAVFKEVYRVLKPGGHFLIWDTKIPKIKALDTNKVSKKLFIVPVKIKMPNKTQYTAYGAPWFNRELNENVLKMLAAETGFSIKLCEYNEEAITIILVKEAI